VAPESKVKFTDGIIVVWIITGVNAPVAGLRHLHAGDEEVSQQLDLHRHHRHRHHGHSHSEQGEGAGADSEDKVKVVDLSQQDRHKHKGCASLQNKIKYICIEI